MRSLAAAAGIAAVAEAFATGGLSVGAAAVAIAGTLTPALAAGAAIYGGVKLNSILNDKGTKSTPYNPMSGNMPSVPDITGKGVKKITPTPKPTPTVQQNITVYASNTDDIAKKMSKAAKNGLPIGSR